MRALRYNNTADLGLGRTGVRRPPPALSKVLTPGGTLTSNVNFQVLPVKPMYAPAPVNPPMAQRRVRLAAISSLVSMWEGKGCGPAIAGEFACAYARLPRIQAVTGLCDSRACAIRALTNI